MKLKPLSLVIISSLFTYQTYAISETTVYQYNYDSNGNTVSINQVVSQESKTLYAYSYNDLNQLSRFEDIVHNKSFTYYYYPDGKRLSKQGYGKSGQESILFYYGHQGQLMNESYSKNNQSIKQSSYFAGLRFIDDLIHSNDSHLQYPIADQHNHPATINFTQDATTIESYQLTDYGQLVQSNTKREDKQVTEQGIFNFEINPKIYGSGYYDSESNLQYMGARYYSADTQRFMTQDSYNLLNRYNYANGNPVMNYDPDGHSAMGNFAKSLVPHGVGGGIGLGVSIAADIAITGIALGANPSLGTLMMVGAISGGLSNGLGTAAAESIDSGIINASDVRAQVLLGAAIGGAIATISGIMPAFSKEIYRYGSKSYKAGGLGEIASVWPTMKESFSPWLKVESKVKPHEIIRLQSLGISLDTTQYYQGVYNIALDDYSIIEGSETQTFRNEMLFIKKTDDQNKFIIEVLDSSDRRWTNNFNTGRVVNSFNEDPSKFIAHHQAKNYFISQQRTSRRFKTSQPSLLNKRFLELIHHENYETKIDCTNTSSCIVEFNVSFSPKSSVLPQ